MKVLATASRSEGAKGKAREVVLRVGGDEHATPYMWESAIAAALEEYAREQATCKAHAFRVPPATCCYVGDTISFWDDKFVTAVNEDEKVIDDLRAQLQTLREEHERLKELDAAQAVAHNGNLLEMGDLRQEIARLTQEKAALEARERALREALENYARCWIYLRQEADASLSGKKVTTSSDAWDFLMRCVLQGDKALAALAPRRG